MGYLALEISKAKSCDARCETLYRQTKCRREKYVKKRKQEVINISLNVYFLFGNAKIVENGRYKIAASVVVMLKTAVWPFKVVEIMVQRR
jgi:hypothetical protein